MLSDHDDDKVEGEQGARTDTMPDLMERLDGFPQRPPPPRVGQVREVPIPIQGSAWPALKAAFPLSEEAWAQMIAVLNAMKPGLVEPKKDR